MKIELHALQNFAPANLNRDDTGTPKNCLFGGYRRARISSQSLKRAMREHFAREGDNFVGVRTRRLIVEIAERIAGTDSPPKDIIDLVSDVFQDGGIKRPSRTADAERDNTQILVFLSEPAIDRMETCFRDRWDALKSKNKDARVGAIEELGTILIESARVPQIALFGRMIEVGDKTPFGKMNLRVDAAAQVSQSISTNKVDIEFDYFTAVDDLQRDAETGASMIGTVEFNSACFYRYASVDVNQLARNLAGDGKSVPQEVAGLTRRTVEAFVRAFVNAIPTGKQNSMAAHNPPSFVLAVARAGGNWSLANAFVQPVAPNLNADLVSGSIAALDAYWGDLTAMYGTQDITGKWYAAIGTPNVSALKDARVDGLDALVVRVLEATEAAI
jgi:CRISPR system Cascade subunit CasC